MCKVIKINIKPTNPQGLGRNVKIIKHSNDFSCVPFGGIGINKIDLRDSSTLLNACLLNKMWVNTEIQFLQYNFTIYNAGQISVWYHFAYSHLNLK